MIEMHEKTIFYFVAVAALILFASNCAGCPPQPSPTPAKTTVTVTNQADDATVYVAFGADSKVIVSDWAFCISSGPLTCNFSLTKSASQALPTAGKYLNATITSSAPVGCGTTKAELNVNNPNWYDVLDVSLVDGYSNKIEIIYKPLTSTTTTTLGPPNGQTGNEKVLGVFPYGCDICVARQSPPCGIAPGTDGCKSGTQYKPDVPCQFQGAVKGGGGTVEVILLGT